MRTIPWLQNILNLDGFEFFSFWCGAALAAASAGFLVDAIMKRSAWGPALNGALAAIGAFSGIFLRYRYLPGHYGLEPGITAFCAIGTSVSLMLGLGMVRRAGL